PRIGVRKLHGGIRNRGALRIAHHTGNAARKQLGRRRAGSCQNCEDCNKDETGEAKISHSILPANPDLSRTLYPAPKYVKTILFVYRSYAINSARDMRRL